jgi:Ca2+-binding RTX toxin-like protein
MGMESLERRALLAVDLTGSLDLPSGVFVPGDIISGSFTLENTGLTPAGPFKIEVLLSTDNVFGNADDVSVFSTDVPGMPPLTDETVDADVEVPDVIVSGSYFVIINIDSDNDVDEDDEGNNVIITDLAGIQILSSTGVLAVTGTAGNDVVTTSVVGTTLTVDVNGTSTDYDTTVVTGVAIATGDGDDTITIGNGTGTAYVLAGGGRDQINGSDGDDLLVGGGGKDTINAGDGNDTVFGLGANDIIYGEAGRDVLRGGDGNDYVDGGAQRDIMSGGDGTDTLFGQGGNDSIFAAGDGAADLVRGGLGTDGGEVDELDDVGGVEDLAVV